MSPDTPEYRNVLLQKQEIIVSYNRDENQWEGYLASMPSATVFEDTPEKAFTTILSLAKDIVEVAEKYYPEKHKLKIV
jgi:hypothetical protein